MYFRILPLLLATVVPTIKVNANCPGTFYPPRFESLYLSQKLTFDAARKTCRDLNYTDLAVLDTKEKACHAVSYLRSLPTIGKDIWIGLNYVSKFHWLDGSDFGWTSWHRNENWNEPNNLSTEKCVRLREIKNYDWATAPCSKTYNAVCQRVKNPNKYCSSNSTFCFSSFVLVARGMDIVDHTDTAYARSIFDCAKRCAEIACQYFLFGQNACNVLHSRSNITTSGRDTTLYKIRDA